MTMPAYNGDYDRYSGVGVSPFGALAPARYAAAITPSDTVAAGIGSFGAYPKRLYVGGTGDVTVVTAGDTVGNTVTYKSVPAGTYLNVQVRMVMQTGTTATNIVGEAD